MPINFPDSPTVDQSFTFGDRTWIWDGSTWNSASIGLTATSPVVLTGADISFDSTSIQANATAIATNITNIQANTDALAGLEVVNITDLTATAAELNFTDGVTSAIQPQLDSKAGLNKVVQTITTNYTLLASDNGRRLVFSGSPVVVIPSGVLAAGQEFEFLNIGSGTVTFISSSPIINSFESRNKITQQFARANLLSISNTTGVLLGSIASVPNIGVAGYIAGGNVPALSDSTTAVDKFAFPSDTRTTLGIGLSQKRASSGGVSNSGVAGYIGGGASPSAFTQGIEMFTVIDKFSFPSDSRSVLSGDVATGDQITKMAGMSNAGTAGYFASPADFPWTVGSLRRLAFPTDTLSTLVTSVSESSSGMSNFAVAGYLSGGNDNNFTQFSTVSKLSFALETSSTLGTGLSSARNRTAGMENSGVAGYSSGGIAGAQVTTVDKFAFPSDTRTTLATGLSAASSTHTGMSNSRVGGYFGGSNAVTVDKFAFPSDTRTTLATGLSAVRREVTGMSNEGQF